MASVWRPLKPSERAARRAADFDARLPTLLADSLRFPVTDPTDRGQVLASAAYHDLLLPVLPPSVSRCSTCLIPTVRQTGRCRSCEQLRHALSAPLRSLEFLTMATASSNQHRVLAACKDEIRERGAAPAEWLRRYAAALSAYSEAHRLRLLVDGELVTAVPSGAPTVEAAFAVAAERGWFAPTITPSGAKAREWSSREGELTDRLALRADSWRVDVDVVRGRAVVLFDDVFVTGATVYSYADALRCAGAVEVRAVVLERVVDARVHGGHDHLDALRDVRDVGPYDWSAERAAHVTAG
jgi:predicted amidophosphoribosyltransferase